MIPFLSNRCLGSRATTQHNRRQAEDVCGPVTACLVVPSHRRRAACHALPGASRTAPQCAERSSSRVKAILWPLLLFSVVIHAAVGAAALRQDADDIQWQTLAGEPFVVHYQRQDAQIAQRVLESLVAIYPELSASIGSELQTRTRVFIVPSQQSFDTFTGGVVPHWGEAVADLRRRLIVLKSPRWAQPSRRLDVLVIHELTHLLLAEALSGAQAPRWFNEGLAIYYANDPSYAGATLVSRALLSGDVIPLERIDDLLKFHQIEAQLAYQESYLAVRFVFDRWGPEGVRSLVQGMRRSSDLDTAFREALAIDFVDFQSEWYDYIRKHYRWHFLLEFDTYIWILILFLFIIAFLSIRFRNRRTLRRWQHEEGLSGFQ
jgi:hypothetical protein